MSDVRLALLTFVWVGKRTVRWRHEQEPLPARLARSAATTRLGAQTAGLETDRHRRRARRDARGRQPVAHTRAGGRRGRLAAPSGAPKSGRATNGTPCGPALRSVASMRSPSRTLQEARKVFLAQIWPREVGSASTVLIRKGIEKDPSPGRGNVLPLQPLWAHCVTQPLIYSELLMGSPDGVRHGQAGL